MANQREYRPPASRAARNWVLGGVAVAVGIGVGLLARPHSAVPSNAAAPEAKVLAFNADRAFSDLTKQVGFGPRVPNMKGHRECLEYFVTTLTPLADSVTRQEFSQRIRGEKLNMTNVIARWDGKPGSPTGSGVLLAAHWDTRPTADYEQSRDRRRTPIPGANDGASGAAVLLELARLFKQAPPSVPVSLVLFDGEDVGPGVEDMFLGSIYFADHLPANTPKRGVLIDMIGDRDLSIPQEGNSLNAARDVVDEIYAIAQRKGLERQFPAQPGPNIEDDHIPLHKKGLRVADLIDFNYGPGHSWWHTLDDTPDKCSPASLKAVGDVLLEWVYTQK